MVSIAEESRQYLTFQNRGIVHRYRALPFGVSVAPRIFSKLMTYAVELCERKESSGIVSGRYLLVSQDEDETSRPHSGDHPRSFGPGVYNQSGEIRHDREEDSRLSRIYLQHDDHADKRPPRQNWTRSFKESVRYNETQRN